MLRRAEPDAAEVFCETGVDARTAVTGFGRALFGASTALQDGGDEHHVQISVTQDGHVVSDLE